MLDRTRPTRRGARASSGDGRARRRWSVGTHLLAIMLAATVLAAGALGYGYAWSADQATRSARDLMADQAQVAARDVTDAIATGVAQVEALAGQPGLAGVLARPGACTLTVGGPDPFTTARIDVVDLRGDVVCSSDAAAVDRDARAHGGAGWLEPALRGTGAPVAWPAPDAVTDRPAVVVPRAFAGPDGAPAGVVALVLPTGGAGAVLTESSALPRDAIFTVVDTASRRVVSTSSARVTGEEGDAVALTRAAGRGRGLDGVDRVFASADVTGVPWRVYAGLEHASVLASAQGTLVRQSLIGGGALLALAAALWLLNLRVAGPLRDLTRGAVRARDDAGDARVPEAGTSELAALARAFNTMLDIRAGQAARLAHQASHDRVTGLPTADWFRARLDELLARTPGDGGVAVLAVGLRRVDAVGEAFGPDGAQRVLADAAARLRAAARPGDVLARAEGYAFLVALDGVTADEAGALARRLHDAVAQPPRWPAAGAPLEVSTGIAVRTAGAAAQTLLRDATTAMSAAAAAGSAWSLFDERMRVRATEQLETERGLRDALARDELVVHYQPIVDLGTGRTVGAEALVRWQHPQRGLVPPMQFVPVAEATGQIGAIGALVLRRACEQAVRWGAGGADLVVSVNVAADQLLDDGFADMVADLLAEVGLAPERLCLEVTETAVVRRAGGGAENLHALRRLGVGIAVDDFGTGYSSLSYLQHLPVTTLKVDRSFVTGIADDGRDRHLVEAVLVMARALGLTVVAEGVETPEQRDLLAGLGCGTAQGYLFGRPVPPDELTGLAGASAARPAA